MRAPTVSHFLHIFAIFNLLTKHSIASKPHLIRFRLPGLNPKGLAYDPFSEHFIVASTRQPILASVSDAGVEQTLIHDTSLPPNSSFQSIAFDKLLRRILVSVQSIPPSPPYSALAAYDQSSLRRIFLSPLPFEYGSTPVASAIAMDSTGNYFVTNSNGNIIWKVNVDGKESSIWSKSPLFNQQQDNNTTTGTSCGLSGVVYVNLGYLLVVQSNTGKLFKVDSEGGQAREVAISKKLVGARGLALRSDGVLLVVSKKVWFVKSSDSWGEGVVYDETLLDEKQIATAIVVGRDRKGYVAYGGDDDGKSAREWFEIEEVQSAVEGEDERIWIYVVMGLGLAYFLIWRFQMRRLVNGLDKKIN